MRLSRGDYGAQSKLRCVQPYDVFFCAPVFPEEEKTLEARKVWLVLVGACALVNVLVPATMFFLAEHANRLWVVLVGFDLMTIGLLGLLHVGRIRLAAYVMVAVALALDMYAIWGAGGLRAPGITGFLVAVSIGGLLLGPRAALGFGIVAGACSFFLLVAEQNGWLPPATTVHTPLSLWITLMFYLFLLVVVQMMFSRLIRKAEDAEKTAVASLRQKTALMEAQLSSTIDGVLVVDLEGRKILQNRRIIEIFKIPPAVADNSDDSQQVKFVLQQVKHPEQFLQKVTYLYNYPKEISRDEVELVDGTTLDRYSAPVLGAGGELLGRIWTFRDISELKRHNVALRESQQRLESLFENSPAGIGLVAPSGRFKMVNPAFCAIFGYTSEELLAMDFTKVTHPDDLEISRQTLREALEGKGKILRFQKRYVHKDGRILVAEVSSEVVFAADGAPLHFITQVVDITERKKAEEALHESEKKFATVFHDAPVMIALSDLVTAKYIEINAEGLRVSGFTREEVIGRTAAEVGWMTSAQRENLKKAILAHGQISPMELEFRAKDGRTMHGLSKGEQIVVGGRPCLLTVTVDITEQKALEARLIQAQKMEAIGQLAGGVAHDFNNILASSMLYLGLLRKNPSLSDEVKNTLKELETESKRAADLTRQLLSFSRRQIMQVRPLDLNGVLANILKMIRRLLGEHIKVVLTGGSSALWIEADPGMIDQVIMNLCINARDAMPHGGELHIETRLVQLMAESLAEDPEVLPGRFVCLTVRDSGCGMDAETLKHIFEPFFTTKAMGNGTGLGLATVYGIIKQHRGRITVESELGAGSTFNVYMPAINEPLNRDKVDALQEVRGGSEGILLVEDEGILRKKIAQSLRILGYRVWEAESGPRALEIWPECGELVSLLLTDMVMPDGMTGLQLAEQLTRNKPELRVLISSGYSAELVKKGGSSSPGLDYLPKPYSGEVLAKAVRKLLDGVK